MKTRKPILRRSARMAKLMREYNQRKAAFFYEHPYCWVCKIDGATPAIDVHHTKGRGKYLLDISTWVPVCRECHYFIHQHPAWAYAEGWMIKRNL
jgi:hypothetical protein